MSLPILTGGRQRGDEAVARAELEQARLQRQQVEELATLDTQSAWAELLASRAAWEASAGTVAQADRAYQIANVRYGAGVSTQLELSDSRLLLQQAEANRAQAARNLQVARARVALLPNLPIGAGAGTGTATPRAPQAPPPARYDLNHHPKVGVNLQRSPHLRVSSNRESNDPRRLQAHARHRQCTRCRAAATCALARCARRLADGARYRAGYRG